MDDQLHFQGEILAPVKSREVLLSRSAIAFGAVQTQTKKTVPASTAW